MGFIQFFKKDVVNEAHSLVHDALESFHTAVTKIDVAVGHFDNVIEAAEAEIAIIQSRRAEAASARSRSLRVREKISSLLQ